MKINWDYFWRLLSQRTDMRVEWIDFLSMSLYWDFDFAWYFKLLDTDNSNQAFHYWKEFTYTISKSEMNRYMALWVLISIDGISYPIIEIRDFTWKNWWCIACDYSIYFYWTLFRLIQRWDVESLNKTLTDLFDW